jgi:hypothetical protein
MSTVSRGSPRVQDVLTDQAASSWLRAALRSALERDRSMRSTRRWCSLRRSTRGSGANSVWRRSDGSCGTHPPDPGPAYGNGEARTANADTPSDRQPPPTRYLCIASRAVHCRATFPSWAHRQRRSYQSASLKMRRQEPGNCTPLRPADNTHHPQPHPGLSKMGVCPGEPRRYR